MADNYLEKRMDDYARGRVPGPKARRSAGPRPGVAVIKYPPLAVAVLGADRADAADIVSMFVGAGCTVVFTASDAARGREIAQGRGGRFYPGGVAQAEADMASRGERADVAIVCDGSDGLGDARRIRITAVPCAAAADETVIVCDSPSRAALLCLALAQPSAAATGQTITI